MIRVDIDQKSADKVFKKLGNLFNDKRELWNKTATDLREVATKEFTENTNGWEPLKPKTIADKVKKGFSTLIGVASGNLFKAATTNATIIIDNNGMTYEVGRGFDSGYFKFFHAKRPLFQSLGKESPKIFLRNAEEWTKKQVKKNDF